MQSKELLYGQSRQGGKLAETIRWFLDSNEEKLSLFVPNKESADSLAIRIKESFGLQAETKEHIDTSHINVIYDEFAGEVDTTWEVTTLVNKSYSVVVTKRKG